jgi:hypothetical protein
MSTFSSNQGTKSGVMQRIMSILVTKSGRKGGILDQAKIFKHTLSLLLLLFSSWLPLQAQPNTNMEPEIVLDAAAEASPAKAYIKTFWKYIAKLKQAKETGVYSSLNTTIRNAATAINNVKLKDPKYNIAALQNELKQYENLSQNVENQRIEGRHNYAEAAKFLSDFPDASTLNLTGKDDVKAAIVAHDQKLEEFKQKQAAFMASNPDPGAIQQYESRFESKANSYLVQPEDLVAEFNKAEYYETGLGIHRYALVHQVYWTTVASMYTNNAKIQEAAQKADQVFKKMPNPDNMKAVFQQNKAARLKKTFMPPAAVQNPALESEFRRIFNGLNKGETIVKINPRYRDWQVFKSELTGMVTERKYGAYLLVKRGDGTCKLYELIIIQDHLATGYGQSRLDRMEIVEPEFLCENVR